MLRINSIPATADSAPVIEAVFTVYEFPSDDLADAQTASEFGQNISARLVLDQADLISADKMEEFMQRSWSQLLEQLGRGVMQYAVNAIPKPETADEPESEDADNEPVEAAR